MWESYYTWIINFLEGFVLVFFYWDIGEWNSKIHNRECKTDDNIFYFRFKYNFLKLLSSKIKWYIGTRFHSLKSYGGACIFFFIWVIGEWNSNTIYLIFNIITKAAFLTLLYWYAKFRYLKCCLISFIVVLQYLYWLFFKKLIS